MPFQIFFSENLSEHILIAMAGLHVNYYSPLPLIPTDRSQSLIPHLPRVPKVEGDGGGNLAG